LDGGGEEGGRGKTKTKTRTKKTKEIMTSKTFN
jgi:hypothetical protein